MARAAVAQETNSGFSASLLIKDLWPMSNKKSKDRSVATDVWINPKSNLSPGRRDQALDTRFGDTRFGDKTSSRFLELADVALGLKPELRRKRSGGTGNTREIMPGKPEPYAH
jgi:hypothetical protein